MANGKKTSGRRSSKYEAPKQRRITKQQIENATYKDVKLLEKFVSDRGKIRSSLIIILNSDVKSLGRKGDVVDVAKGYARNYLLPKKLAIVATSSNLKFAEELQEKREMQTQANDELAESIKTALADANIVISQTTTDEGTLYAAVSNEQIVDAIETFSGFRLEAEQIDMENQVKEIGLHTISVVLGPDTKFETTLEVIPETK